MEGVGSYRIIYPYGLIDQFSEHSVLIGMEEVEAGGRQKMLLNVPEAVVGGPHGQDADEFLDSDVYVLQRPLETLYAPVAAWLKQHGKTVVMDVDDYVHGLAAAHTARGQVAASPRHSFETMLHCFPYVDLLTVTTPMLAELYGDRVPRTVVLPNRLLRRDWEEIVPAYAQERGRVRVGWQGWMGIRGDDLRVLKRMMRKWLRKHRNVVFVNVGKPDALTYMDIPRDQRVHVPGARFPGHAPLVARIDIGLVPLQMSTFNEAKSCLKGMEYGACGIPCIASPTAEYRGWVDEGSNGYLANTPGEWMDALDAMLEGERWRELGRNNRVKAHQNFLDDCWADWLTPYAAAA